METMLETHELTAAPVNPQMFGNAGREHMKKYGKCRYELLMGGLEVMSVGKDSA